MKDKEIKELVKCECVSSVMTIEPVLNIDRSKIGTLVILLIIDDGVYVCNCTVYSYVLKQFTQHAFFYNSHFQQNRIVNDVVQSLIIYHMHPYFYWSKKI